MPWVRLEDSFPRHPKVIGLSSDAFKTYVVGLCYCSEFLTDGYIPAMTVARAARAVNELVESGLWTTSPDGTGFLVHDYLSYQASRAQVEDKRKRQSEAGRRGAERRWGTHGHTP